jgi:hypothetical protein
MLDKRYKRESEKLEHGHKPEQKPSNKGKVGVQATDHPKLKPGTLLNMFSSTLPQRRKNMNTPDSKKRN